MGDVHIASQAKKSAGRDRSKSKVSQLGSGLKLNLGGPPPAEPGSMEWLRQQKAAETAGGGGGGGSSIKQRGMNLGIPLGMPPGMSPRTPGGAAPAPRAAAGTGAASLADEVATPKLSGHPTSARASRGKRKAATRRPRGKRTATSGSESAKETPEQPTTPAATTPRGSVNAAPPGALVLPTPDSTPKRVSAAPPGALVLPAPGSTPKRVSAAPAGALVLPKFGVDGDTPEPERSASQFFPRSKAAKEAAASLKEPDKSPPKPKFVPPEGIDPQLTVMYELANEDPSEPIGLEALQQLVDSGEVQDTTRVWCEPMEDCESRNLDPTLAQTLMCLCNYLGMDMGVSAGATFDGASWRCGHGARTLMYETQDEEPSDETPMARVQELVTEGALNGATRVWTDGMEDWSNLSDVAMWLALTGVEAVQDRAVADAATATFIYDTDGDGTPSEEVSVDQIDALIEAGTLSETTMIWSEGWDDWLSLGEGGREKLAGAAGTTFIYDTDGDGTPSEEVSVDQIDALIEAGTLSEATMIWSEGWDDWLSLGEAKGILTQTV
jgi:hypothetical protein